MRDSDLLAFHYSHSISFLIDATTFGRDVSLNQVISLLFNELFFSEQQHYMRNSLSCIINRPWNKRHKGTKKVALRNGAEFITSSLCC